MTQGHLGGCGCPFQGRLPVKTLVAGVRGRCGLRSNTRSERDDSDNPTRAAGSREAGKPLSL